MTDRVTCGPDSVDLLLSADRHPSGTEVDEIVVSDAKLVHLERMDIGYYWIRIDRRDGSAVILHLSSARQDRTPIRTLAEVERNPFKGRGY